ncbi:peptidylprolyl isomerase [Caldichromatium japonicum]|uniref:Periplasmic chaperone PpiD n=1 Tax=Caldichromatium japonicum TaxID=2699430 RepID=A0A6G7VBL4_9GAMM|nr:SurA N-terminal domain-containing protein [Caldichromatium japonicum]QIK37364.1 peptidylprolyl isomerase [Caldichromatium japonicum]
MLQVIRDRAQGWIAWAIIILISIPFALWGIQSYLGINSEPVAAAVNGVEIPARELDRRLQEVRLEQRERLGDAYDPAALNDQRLRAEVLESMIDEAVLMDTVKRLNLRVSDQDVQMQILADPAFIKEGRFDKDTYERLLRYQGLTPALYEAQLRQRMSAIQLLRAVAGSELVTRAELAAYQQLMGQRREIEYLRLPLANYRQETPIDETRIAAYYEANRARFQVSEQVRLDYLLLDVDRLVAEVAVNEEEIRQHYEAKSSRFNEPERREVRHILRTLDPQADEAAAAAALDQIQAIRARIQAGESFEELAKALSQDPGSAANGGALGIIAKGMMDPEFERAAFTLAVGELSEPVRTPFGYHLIQVTRIQPAAVKPLEAVRDQLRAEVARQKAEESFFTLSEQLSTLSYEHPDSLEPAAAKLGLPIEHSDWIGRGQRGEGILYHPKVLAAAFTEEVLLNGRNSDPIEPERDRLQVIVLRATGHREASVRPLEEVRETIIEAIRAEQSRAAAKSAAEEIAEKLREGADWTAAAGDLKPEMPGLIERQSPGLPAGILDLAFKLPAPTADKASIGTAILDDGDAVVVRVKRIEEGPVEVKETGTLSPGSFILAQVMEREAYSSVLNDLKARAKIIRHETREERAE